MNAAPGPFPWGDGPPPVLSCEECGARLVKGRGHYVVAGAHLLCSGCLLPDGGLGSTRRLHARYYPNCPDARHEMWDHEVRNATRAAAWYLLLETVAL